jgi:hypothetical protein
MMMAEIDREPLFSQFPGRIILLNSIFISSFCLPNFFFLFFPLGKQLDADNFLAVLI